MVSREAQEPESNLRLAIFEVDNIGSRSEVY